MRLLMLIMGRFLLLNDYGLIVVKVVDVEDDVQNENAKEIELYLRMREIQRK